MKCKSHVVRDALVPNAPSEKDLLVSRLMGNGESQSKSWVFIDGAASVLTAHPTNGCKPCRTWRECTVGLMCNEWLCIYFLMLGKVWSSSSFGDMWDGLPLDSHVNMMCWCGKRDVFYVFSGAHGLCLLVNGLSFYAIFLEKTKVGPK